MAAKKIAISLSEEALALVDRSAAQEGISRSAWFERAAQRARRQAGMRSALQELRRQGMKMSTAKELDALRKELSRAR